MGRASILLLSAGGLFVLPTAVISALQDRPTGETEVCANETCHPGIVDRKVMHRPTAQRQCLDCHDYDDPARHRFELVTEKQELCWECHDLDFEEFAHAPVDEGNCTGCHDPHGSDQPGLLAKATSAGLCLDCHEQEFADRKFVHGPVAAQACLACHEPHSSPHEKLLTNAPTALCLDCHSEVVPADPAQSHRHQPLEEGCQQCHDAHASDARYQLHSEAPDLCFSCHGDVKETFDGAKVVHAPVVDVGGCTTCHSPHFSAAPGLLAGPQADLCLNCHGKPIETATGRTLTDMSVLLKENPDRHGPVRDGECTACHQPHASEHAGLLVAEYPRTFYVPYEFERYELCFNCHSEEMVEDESGTDLTGFRHGDRNLHWLHVNRKKGRTCRICHDVHASRRPFHIRETTPFGDAGWMLKLKYEQTTNGGKCGPGCHGPQTYDRSAGAPGIE
ncbi:MAG: cytochrome c3 family protein [Planctomycetota bacterium]|jgi:predicted CXXCH cytochrome family protein